MNQARRVFPLQDNEACFLCANQGGTTIQSSLAMAGDVFLRRGNHERKTEILHLDADLLSQR